MMYPTSATPIMGNGQGFSSPYPSNSRPHSSHSNSYGTGPSNSNIGNSFNMQSSPYYQRHRAAVRRRRHYLYFCSFMVLSAIYLCYSGRSRTKAASDESSSTTKSQMNTNAMQSTMMTVDRSHHASRNSHVSNNHAKNSHVNNKRQTTKRKRMTAANGDPLTLESQQLQRQEQQEENEGDTTSYEEEQEPAMMQLVLLPAGLPLPSGGLSIDESSLAYLLNQVLTEEVSPKEPLVEENFVKASSTLSQNQAKTYVNHWNGGTLRLEEPQKFQLTDASTVALKTYIDKWNGGSLRAEEPQLKMGMGPKSGKGGPEGHVTAVKDHPQHSDGILPGVSTPDTSEQTSSSRFQFHLPEHLIEDLKEELQSKIVDPAEAWQSSIKDSTTTISSEGFKPLMDSQAKDQLLIIGTVASMALMVGAISARKLRRRAAIRQDGYYPDAASDFLSTCIENNAEDELAYDTATTASGAYSAILSNAGFSRVNRAGAYDTFSEVSNGWRNDLEKFDV